MVNGKPAIGWIMERYQIAVDKDSGIRNDPTTGPRHNQPRYILDLVKRIITVGLNWSSTPPPLNERRIE